MSVAGQPTRSKIGLLRTLRAKPAKPRHSAWGPFKGGASLPFLSRFLFL